MTVQNALAYCSGATITTVKGFTARAPVLISAVKSFIAQALVFVCFVFLINKRKIKINSDSFRQNALFQFRVGGLLLHVLHRDDSVSRNPG